MAPKLAPRVSRDPLTWLFVPMFTALGIVFVIAFVWVIAALSAHLYWSVA